MSTSYTNLNELKAQKKALLEDVQELEKLITFKNPKQSLSAITDGYTDQFLDEEYDENGNKKIKFNTDPVVRGISGQVKSKLNRNEMIKIAQSDSGSELLMSLLKLGVASAVVSYGRKKMRNRSWKKKIIGAALIYVAPIAINYVKNSVGNYRKNKITQSLKRLI